VDAAQTARTRRTPDIEHFFRSAALTSSNRVSPISKAAKSFNTQNALTDQACFQLSNRGHLREQEAPIGPGGTLGRSQKTKSLPEATRDRRRSTLRVSRSSLAKTSLAPIAFAWESAAASFGLSEQLTVLELSHPCESKNCLIAPPDKTFSIALI